MSTTASKATEQARKSNDAQVLTMEQRVTGRKRTRQYSTRGWRQSLGSGSSTKKVEKMKETDRRYYNVNA